MSAKTKGPKYQILLIFVLFVLDDIAHLKILRAVENVIISYSSRDDLLGGLQFSNALR